MNNKDIRIIRKKLDKLDNKKRTLLVNDFLKIKKYKNQIVDKKRIDIILRNIKKKSINQKIDYKITDKIWKSMIKAFIDYEYRNFKKK